VKTVSYKEVGTVLIVLPVSYMQMSSFYYFSLYSDSRLYDLCDCWKQTLLLVSGKCIFVYSRESESRWCRSVVKLCSQEKQMVI